MLLEGSVKYLVEPVIFGPILGAPKYVVKPVKLGSLGCFADIWLNKSKWHTMGGLGESCSGLDYCLQAAGGAVALPVV